MPSPNELCQFLCGGAPWPTNQPAEPPADQSAGQLDMFEHPLGIIPRPRDTDPEPLTMETIERAVDRMREAGLDVREPVIYVNPRQFDTLLQSMNSRYLFDTSTGAGRGRQLRLPDGVVRVWGGA